MAASRYLLSIGDLTSDDVRNLIDNALKMKRGAIAPEFAGKTLALLFEKPSLRTRVSFEVAMRQLGGFSLYLSPEEVGLGKRERISDVARVLSRYADVIAARTFSHQTVRELARHAGIPLINALSDEEHPCQALGDLLTIQEKKGTLKGLKLAYIGDGNNVARSLLLAASLMGTSFIIASPANYGIPESTWQTARKNAARNNCEVTATLHAKSAVEKADVVYTDVWTSMGQEPEADIRRRIFAPYQVNKDLLGAARTDALFMHPLPAHHGEELAEGILEDPRSVVFDQAENRLHIQKAILQKVLS